MHCEFPFHKQAVLLVTDLGMHTPAQILGARVANHELFYCRAIEHYVYFLHIYLQDHLNIFPVKFLSRLLQLVTTIAVEHNIIWEP